MKRIFLASGMIAGMILCVGCNNDTPQGVSLTTDGDQNQVAAACSPYFSKQPASLTIPCGTTNWVKFSVTVAGATVSSYQWYYNYDGGTTRYLCNTKYFTGGTTATLSYAPQSPIYVWCRVAASCGTVIWSNRAQLNITNPTITRQPADATDPCGVANMVPFTVRVTGATEYAYEWFWAQSPTGPWRTCINDKYFTGGNTARLMAYPVDTRWLKCEINSCGQTLTTRVAKFTVCYY